MREAFVGVSNEQFLGICAWVGLATMLAQAGVTHHGIYIQRVCAVYAHVYNVPILQENPIARMLAECPISQYNCGC